jgi:hypothetical protein
LQDNVLVIAAGIWFQYRVCKGQLGRTAIPVLSNSKPQTSALYLARRGRRKRCKEYSYTCPPRLVGTERRRERRKWKEYSYICPLD